MLNIYLGPKGDSNQLAYWSVQTEDDGSVLVPDLPPAAYEIVATTMTGDTADFFIRAPVTAELKLFNRGIRATAVSLPTGRVVPTIQSKAGVARQAIQVWLQNWQGVVFDQSGAVIAGVAVEVQQAQGRKGTKIAKSDAAGRFSLNLESGRYLATFTSPGFRPEVLDVELGAKGWKALRLTMRVGGGWCGDTPPPALTQVAEPDIR
jgi:hypothetical protein